ncbi:MAG TPA: ATP-binding cassette domain-containing protein [Holophaga sp.]|nr:ATP-binding cassette domain-containing protein [Holophaga sp.]
MSEPGTTSLLACPACGEDNLPGSRFCDRCGAPLPREAQRVLRIGRNPESDIVLDFPMVSWDHARLVTGGPRPILEDLGSSNGTAIGHPGNRIRSAELDPAQPVYFGSLQVPGARLLQGPLVRGTKAHTTLGFEGASMVLGRAPECDQVLDYPMVSWKHARITRSGAGYTVEDLGSSNGTFLNGRRVGRSAPVRPGDVIGLGSFTFTLTAAGSLEKRSCQGNLAIEARNLCIDVEGRRLVEDVSLTLFSSELVALMGTSGAGKTTLLNALCGYMKPSHGAVLYNGQDLYANYDQFRSMIGYAPQDDIMHRELTVFEALLFTARLRLPEDTTPDELESRVRRAIAAVNLEGTEDVLIGSPEKKGISGGQRKRVNIAMELLTEPEVLFLDEPTSGLSSKDSLELMGVLRGLANAGKTILMIIHQPSPEIFGKLDSLIQLAKDRQAGEPGRLVYYGPAVPDAYEFFGGASRRPEQIEVALDQRSARDWAARYRATDTCRQFVEARRETSAAVPGAGIQGRPTRGPGLGQWLTLLKRMLVIKRRDTWNLAILLGQAPLIALLLVLGFGESGKGADPGNLSTVLFLEAMAALWFGCSNSAREIVAEWPIYRRERMATLKVPSYVASKYTILGLLCVIQCLTLTGIVQAGCDVRAPWGAMFGTLLLASFVGLSVGLTISALVRTAETAVALVPIVLLPMIILGGIMKPIHRLPGSVRPAAAVMPSRWAFESLLQQESAHHPAFTDAAEILRNGGKDMAARLFPEDSRHTPQEANLVLAAMLLVLGLGTGVILRAKDTH